MLVIQVVQNYITFTTLETSSSATNSTGFKSDLSMGANIGIVVGGAVVLLLVFAEVAWFMKSGGKGKDEGNMRPLRPRRKLTPTIIDQTIGVTKK